MDPSLELQEPDEARPSKRLRLDASLEITEEVQEEMIDDDGWDDIYDDVGEPRSEAMNGLDGSIVQTSPAEPPVSDVESGALQEQEPESEAVGPSTDVKQLAPTLGSASPLNDGWQEDKTELHIEKGLPATSVDRVEELMDVPLDVQNTAERTLKTLEGTSAADGELHPKVETSDGHEDRQAQREEKLDEEDPTQNAGGAGASNVTNGDAKSSTLKATEDVEFMAAAAAQKGNEEAEWQYDPSDAESSSNSDSDSDADGSLEDSDSESDAGYEMLDPATAAKILMAGDGEDDDGGKGDKKNGGDPQPRTTNEQKEVTVPKPNVVVTEDMKITELGIIDRTVENLILVKASTPGEFQVLESGSVLCNEKREVVGAVAETLGRVQEPMYSVAFTNAKEIEEAGLVHGTKVYYVDEHSTFVFTQPLKNLKGTDASNIHDEEVGEDEMEFSDDEAEAEYKRQKKLAKRAGRGGFVPLPSRGGPRTFGVPGHDSGPTYVDGSDAPRQHYGGGMSYDDNESVDEFYSPLKRPENLSKMMSGGALPPPPPPPPRPQHSGFDRGRGRGRGDRGRGDRGRGRGDRGRWRREFNQRGGGGRGGGHAQSNGHRGNAQSFPDRHANERTNGHQQHSLPSRPSTSHGSPPPRPPPPPQQYPPHSQHQEAAQAPQSYHFNGYTFQYGHTPPQGQPATQANYYQQPPPSTPATLVPPGAFVNPAFFQNQQQAQWLQAQQAGYAMLPGQPQPQQQQHRQPSNSGVQQQQSNLADILRNLSGRS